MSKFNKEFYAERYAKNWNLHNYAHFPFYDSAQAYELHCISKKEMRAMIEKGEDPMNLLSEDEALFCLEYLDSTGYWVAMKEEDILHFIEDEDDNEFFVEVIDDYGEREAWRISEDAYDPERKLIFFDTSKYSGSTEIIEEIKQEIENEIEEEKYEAEQEAAKNKEA